jgi:hypothetical protein
MREGPAALAVMRKSQRGGMYPYLRLSRGQQVEALVPSRLQHITVRVGGDAGVLTFLSQDRSRRDGILIRYAVVDAGSASLDASGTSGGQAVHYATGVTATC